MGYEVSCLFPTVNKTNPNSRKIICCGKTWPKRHFLTFFNLIYLRLGWPWVGEFRRFHDNICMLAITTALYADSVDHVI